MMEYHQTPVSILFPEQSQLFQSIKELGRIPERVFCGSNYGRLLSIKNEYDPYHKFYMVTAVESEYWAPEAKGRL